MALEPGNSRAFDTVMVHPDDMPAMSSREYCAYRKRYWQYKPDQADDYVPLADILGREGTGIWL